MDTEVLKDVVVPIGTFFAGVGVKWLFDRRSQQRVILAENIKELMELLNEWYDQIHKLAIHLWREEGNKGNKSLELLERQYITERQLLQRVQYRIGVLRGFKKCKDFLICVDGFLNILTYSEPERIGCIGCIPPVELRLKYLEEKASHVAVRDRIRMERDVMDEILRDLDGLLQELAEKASALTKT